MDRKNKRDFKKGICLDSSRRRREENSIRLRKDSKIESIAKRRNVQQIVQSSEEDEGNIPLQKLFADLISSDINLQTLSLKGFRRLLSAEKNPPILKCIELGLVPILVQFLENTHNQEQQFEAAWALTNISSSEHTQVVVQHNAIPKLVALLVSQNAEVREQCAWCLGNIAGDGSELRDYILSQNAMNPLLLNITQAASISLLRNCTWTLSNFCRGKPQPDLNILSPALTVLGQLIQHEIDAEAMIDAAWALSYISDGDDQRIQAVIDLGVVPALIKMIQSDNTAVIIPALRTLGNIVSGNDKQTQTVLDSHALPALSNLLTHTKKSIRKETCWVLSNIAAGTVEQLSSLFSVSGLLPRVLVQLSNSTEWDVRKEAAWVVCNVITSSKREKILHLMELGVVSILCDLLGVGEPKIILIALDALEVLLKTTDCNYSGTTCSSLIEESGGIELLEKLQEHENTKVYEKAVHLLEKYFAVEEEIQSENVKPETTNTGFSFGLPKIGQKIENTGFSSTLNTHQHFFNF